FVASGLLREIERDLDGHVLAHAAFRDFERDRVAPPPRGMAQLERLRLDRVDHLPALHIAQHDVPALVTTTLGLRRSRRSRLEPVGSVGAGRQLVTQRAWPATSHERDEQDPPHIDATLDRGTRFPISSGTSYFNN